MEKNITILASVFFSACSVFAQVKESEIISKNWRGEAELIQFDETVIRADDASVTTFLQKQFNYDEGTTFLVKPGNLRTENRFISQKYQQFYKGIAVEHGVQNVVYKDDQLTAISGRFVFIEGLSITPQLNEKQALSFAVNAIDARAYMWEAAENEAFLKQEQNDPAASYYPKGELVVVEKDLLGERPVPVLAYKFNIYAAEPLSRSYVYVDANTGDLVFKDPIIKHVTGTGATRYSGQRTFETQQASTSQFKLRDYTRGQGVETYNMKKGVNYGSAVDFIDTDNNWTAAEFNNANKDNAALDAQWGAQKVYDYFYATHGRSSYNNSGGIIRNYVHYSNNYDNAFWDGQRMTYGDGGSYFTPLTSIDVVAHEIGHGVCSSTADLVYSGESGALNEGLSDIWGAMVEYYAAPSKQTYLIGEDIRIGGGSLRSMLNPKSLGQPSTYNGTYWVGQSGCNPSNSNDYCGVHTNSGVLNLWFYILAEGKSGTNDLSNAYSVVGIGKDKAAKIIYRAETAYFTSTTNYAQARNATIQAAKDLYGANSVEAGRTCQAWYAVGVGNNICGVTAKSAYSRNGTFDDATLTTSDCNTIRYELAPNGNNQFVVKELKISCDKSTSIGEEVSTVSDNDMAVEMYDYQGKEVLHTTQNNLNFTHLKPGVYIMKLSIANQMIIKKVVIN